MTYSNDILPRNIPIPRYDGLQIVVSRSEMRELFRHGLSLTDVVEVLENGNNAPRKRKHNTVEKWLVKRGKVINAIVVKDYNEQMKEECWVLIHIGTFTPK